MMTPSSVSHSGRWSWPAAESSAAVRRAPGSAGWRSAWPSLSRRAPSPLSAPDAVRHSAGRSRRQASVRVPGRQRPSASGLVRGRPAQPGSGSAASASRSRWANGAQPLRLGRSSVARLRSAASAATGRPGAAAAGRRGLVRLADRPLLALAVPIRAPVLSTSRASTCSALAPISRSTSSRSVSSAAAARCARHRRPLRAPRRRRPRRAGRPARGGARPPRTRACALHGQPCVLEVPQRRRERVAAQPASGSGRSRGRAQADPRAQSATAWSSRAGGGGRLPGGAAQCPCRRRWPARAPRRPRVTRGSPSAAAATASSQLARPRLARRASRPGRVGVGERRSQLGEPGGPPAGAGGGADVPGAGLAEADLHALPEPAGDPGADQAPVRRAGRAARSRRGRRGPGARARGRRPPAPARPASVGPAAASDRAAAPGSRPSPADRGGGDVAGRVDPGVEQIRRLQRGLDPAASASSHPVGEADQPPQRRARPAGAGPGRAANGGGRVVAFGGDPVPLPPTSSATSAAARPAGAQPGPGRRARPSAGLGVLGGTAAGSVASASPAPSTGGRARRAGPPRRARRRWRVPVGPPASRCRAAHAARGDLRGRLGLLDGRRVPLGTRRRGRRPGRRGPLGPGLLARGERGPHRAHSPSRLGGRARAADTRSGRRRAAHRRPTRSRRPRRRRPARPAPAALAAARATRSRALAASSARCPRPAVPCRALSALLGRRASSATGGQVVELLLAARSAGVLAAARARSEPGPSARSAASSRSSARDSLGPRRRAADRRPAANPPARRSTDRRRAGDAVGRRPRLAAQVGGVGGEEGGGGLVRPASPSSVRATASMSSNERAASTSRWSSSGRSPSDSVSDSLPGRGSSPAAAGAASAPGRAAARTAPGPARTAARRRRRGAPRGCRAPRRRRPRSISCLRVSGRSSASSSEKSTPTRPSTTKYQRLTLSVCRLACSPMPTVTASPCRPSPNSIHT